MSAPRDRPYAQFNFLVDLGSGQTDGPEAGFMEVSGLSTSIDVIEYRNGNDKQDHVRKLTGLSRVEDVTLRRGIVGSLELYQWLDDIRNGNQSALRSVRISLQSEDHSSAVVSWRLLNARITKHTSGPLNAKGNDVAMEELVLTHERLEME